MPTPNAPGSVTSLHLPREQRAARVLNRRDFFRAVVVQLKSALPPELADFRQRANPMLLKIDYGNERIHYEVWPDSARGHVEVGLHFEDGPLSTAAYLANFDVRIVEIKHVLGASIELERWTATWGHLFESIPLAPLDRCFVDQIAGRLSAQITLLQPLVTEAGVPAERSADPTPRRGRWRGRSGKRSQP